MRSSLLPLASIILVEESASLGIGESARHLMADVWALKRNESENFTSGSDSPSYIGVSPSFAIASLGLRMLEGIAAIIPCSVRS